MLGLISIVGPKPGETGKEPGLKKAENHTLAINYTLKPILITVDKSCGNHSCECA